MLLGQMTPESSKVMMSARHMNFGALDWRPLPANKNKTNKGEERSLSTRSATLRSGGNWGEIRIILTRKRPRWFRSSSVLQTKLSKHLHTFDNVLVGMSLLTTEDTIRRVGANEIMAAFSKNLKGTCKCFIRKGVDVQSAAITEFAEGVNAFRNVAVL